MPYANMMSGMSSRGMGDGGSFGANNFFHALQALCVMFYMLKQQPLFSRVDQLSSIVFAQMSRKKKVK